MKIRRRDISGMMNRTRYKDKRGRILFTFPATLTAPNTRLFWGRYLRG